MAVPADGDGVRVGQSLVTTLLAKSRDDRPESATEVARLIRQAQVPTADKPKAGGWKRWLGL